MLFKKMPFHVGMSKDLVLLERAELKVATSINQFSISGMQ